MSPMLTTVGQLDPPLGNTRLQIVRLFSALLQCPSELVAQEFIKLRSFNTLMVGGGGATREMVPVSDCVLL